MRKAWTSNSIEGALDEAYQSASELCEEMRDAFDNTPEQFKSNSGRFREIAADDLDSLLHPSIPPGIAGDAHHVTWLEMLKGKDGKLFRPARRDNVVRCLEACLYYASTESDDSDAMQKFRTDLKIDISILRSIRFPGMSA